MISVILLAAGKSERMGKPKQLMTWGRGTILGQVIDNFLASAVDEVIVVLGYRAEEIRKIISAKPVKVVINQDYARGMSTSMGAGLGMVDSRAQGVIFALGDQPLVDSQTIDKLVSEFYRSGKGIIIPVYRGRRGNPVILAMKYRDELLRITGDTGGRVVIQDHPEDILKVAVDSEGVCSDIDTMADYNKLIAKG